MLYLLTFKPLCSWHCFSSSQLCKTTMLFSSHKFHVSCGFGTLLIIFKKNLHISSCNFPYIFLHLFFSPFCIMFQDNFLCNMKQQCASKWFENFFRNKDREGWHDAEIRWRSDFLTSTLCATHLASYSEWAFQSASQSHISVFSNSWSPEILHGTLLLQDSCHFCQQTILSAIADIFREICQEMPFRVVLNNCLECAEVSPVPLVIHVGFWVQNLLRLNIWVSWRTTDAFVCLGTRRRPVNQILLDGADAIHQYLKLHQTCLCSIAVGLHGLFLEAGWKLLVASVRCC